MHKIRQLWNGSQMLSPLNIKMMDTMTNPLPPTILDRVKHNFTESIHTKINSADILADILAIACEKFVQCLLDGHKILTCGNGGSACDAIRFTSEMLNRFKHERPGLPSICLNSDVATITSIANDYSFNDIFAKQLRALGQAGDILLAISTSGNSTNVANAIKTAHDKKINVIALTGADGGKISGLLQDNDIEIRVPAYEAARIQETHLLIIHTICDIVDYQLFGHGELVT
jgi:phosphoheptose isomerase